MQGVRVSLSCKDGERFACRGSFGWSLELWLVEDWKTRVLIALEEYDVVDFAVKDVPRPEEEEEDLLAAWSTMPEIQRTMPRYLEDFAKREDYTSS